MVLARLGPDREISKMILSAREDGCTPGAPMIPAGPVGPT